MAESPELLQALTDQWTFDGESDLIDQWAADEGGKSGFPAFHSDQLRDFASAIAENREPTVTGLAAYQALEIVKGVYLSQARRMPVALPMTAEDRAEADRLTSGEGA
jgi:predicted dehydrogenase